MTANLFDALPAKSADEEFSELLARPGLKIERIVSTGQCSPPGFWYDQADGEWVVLLQGAAELRLADEPAARRLKPGDHLHLPPGCRHRVDWTDPGQTTVWLAVHYSP